MPVELILTPLMRPIVVARALLFHPHRSASRYIPHTIDLEESKLTEFAIRKRFGTGSKIYDVFEVKDAVTVEAEGETVTETETGTKKTEERVFWLEPVATLRAGLRSNVLLIKSSTAPVSELGWHIVSHKVDAVDAYRMFTLLSDGSTLQWTSSGKYLERVKNLGEKESEVRERIAVVEPAGPTGFTLKVDISKVPSEMAITTAMISFIDQWNTGLGMGGIYYAYQPFHANYKRD
ncbi:unnamed protein product [[Candida] boidinii]|nr:unnamed protein product [[Candida] boidinii]